MADREVLEYSLLTALKRRETPVDVELALGIVVSKLPLCELEAICANFQIKLRDQKLQKQRTELLNEKWLADGDRHVQDTLSKQWAAGDYATQFLWYQLVTQEIWMWIYLDDPVTPEDLKFIVDRRGFDPATREYLVEMLKYIGMGDLLEAGSVPCELCEKRVGNEVGGRRICAVCEARLVEDKEYVDGQAVFYDRIPKGLYKGK